MKYVMQIEEFCLAGSTVNAKKVEEQIAELNVQLDNLCQVS